MSSAIKTAAGVAATVRGPIPAGEMGITLPHEHLLLRHTPPEVVLDDPDLAAMPEGREGKEMLIKMGVSS